MKQTVLRLLLLSLAVLYTLLVYSWWVEGNNFRRQQEVEQQNKDLEIYKHKQGCITVEGCI